VEEWKLRIVFRDDRNVQTVETAKVRSRQAGLAGRLRWRGDAPHHRTSWRAWPKDRSRNRRVVRTKSSGFVRRLTEPAPARAPGDIAPGPSGQCANDAGR